MDPKADVSSRALAVATYAFVARDAAAVPALRALIEAKRTDPALRQEALTTLARIATTEADLAFLRRLADATQNEAARDLDLHIARIEIARRCAGDIGCLAGTLSATADDLVPHLKPYVPSVETWTREEKAELVAAQIERAMIDLGKRGTNAAAQTDALLAAVASDLRLVRSSVLLALPRIAALPCGRCVEQLDRAIEASAGRTSDGDLRIETMVLRNYFVWAGTP